MFSLPRAARICRLWKGRDINMASKLKRITFVSTPEMEPLLDGMKKERFYNCSQSEMIRTLLEEGWKSVQKDKQSTE